MEEIETKILEVDVENLREKFDEMDAEKVFEKTVRSEFYDFGDGRIEKNGQIRLRSVGERSFITRKIDIEDDRAKVKEEIEFDVGDKEAARKFLESIGLEKIKSGTKKRAKWNKESIEYVIDWYPEVPPLLEIEAPSHQELQKALEKLGYKSEEAVNWGSTRVHEHYDVTR